MKRYFLALVALVVFAAGVLASWHYYQAQQKDKLMVRKLAIDQLHRDCDEMRERIKSRHDLSSLTDLMDVMNYELNISRAIDGNENDAGMNKVSDELQGPLTPETKIRIHATANEYMQKAQRVFDEGKAFEKR
jgi:hypothetical protein